MRIEVGGRLGCEPSGERQDVTHGHLSRGEIQPDTLADAVGHGAALSLRGDAEPLVISLGELNLRAYHAYMMEDACLQVNSKHDPVILAGTWRFFFRTID